MTLDEAAVAYREARADLDAMMAEPIDRATYEAKITAWRDALVALERAALAKPKAALETAP